jgi:DNA-binding MarR family transcriptional regulator
MSQATTPRVPPRDPAGGTRPTEDLVTALTSLLTHLKRKSGDPDTSARAFLLGHVERLAPVRATDLADHVSLDLSTISRHLRGLEDSGYLTRSPDPDDRRASLLSVTDDGRVFLEHSCRARAALFDRATTDWDDGDVATLSVLLDRLAHDLEIL